MTEPRRFDGPGAGNPADARAVPGALMQDGCPHGYDAGEFAPSESRRDFPARRNRGPDEERLLLRAANEAFEGPDRRADVDADAQSWDGDEDVQEGEGPSPRLYRD